MPPIMRLSVKLLVVLIQPHFFQYRQKDCASPHMRPRSSLSVMRWSAPASSLPTRSPNRGSTRVTRVRPCNGQAPLTEIHLNLSRRRPKASTGRCDHLHISNTVPASATDDTSQALCEWPSVKPLTHGFGPERPTVSPAPADLADSQA